MRTPAISRTAKYSAIILIGIAFAVMPLGKGDMYGEVQFKKYQEDRDILERYIEGAKTAQDLESWDNIVQSGKEAMEAEWERDADIRIEAALREGEAADITAVEQEKQEAFAEWEKDIDSRIAEEQGKWYARRQNIIYGELNKDALKAILGQADKAADAAERDARLDAWDRIIKENIGSIEAEWEEPLEALMQKAREEAVTLDEASREAYLKEIERIELEFKDKFRLEKSDLVYSERNELISELYSDSASLKSRSEAESADAIADKILSDTREALKEDERSILNRQEGDYEGSGSINFSNLGENWEQEIKRLMETGLQRWSSAQDDLFREMILWKDNAEYAFEEGNKKWENAYTRLIHAKGAWEQELTAEINRGLEEWRQNQEILNQNIDQARADLENYTKVLSEQWNSHSAALSNMALSGASAYGTAIDNIEWLNEMINYYRNVPTYPNPETVSNLTRDNLSSIQLDTGMILLNAIKEPAPGQNVSLRGFVNDLYNNVDNYHDPDAIRDTWEMNNINQITLEPTFLGYIDNGTYFTERYSLKFTGDYTFTYTYWYKELNSDSRPITSRDTVIKTANFSQTYDYTIDASTGNYAFYAGELRRWEGIRDNFNQIVVEAETYMHNGNIEGYPDKTGNPGVGFLRNSAGQYGLRYNANGELESDTYLMTTAELEYELSKRNLEYWEGRLDIANAVLKYAFPDDTYQGGNPYLVNGKREDASVTENRVHDMEIALCGYIGCTTDEGGTAQGSGRGAKQVYEESLLAVEGIVNTLDNLKGIAGSPDYANSIAGLTQDLNTRKAELDRARENYTAIARSLALLENGESITYLQNEMIEIERNLAESEKTLREKEQEYYTMLRGAEIIDDMGEFSEIFMQTLDERGEAENKFNIYSSIVQGGETDAGLASWVSGLSAEKDAIWGTDAAEKYNTLSGLYTAWNTASPEEKDSKREELSMFIRGEYMALDGRAKGAEALVNLMLDKNFDADAFLKTRPGDGIRDSITENYTNYSDINLNALINVNEAITSGTYESALAELSAQLDGLKFIYGEGADNREYITAMAAYKWAKANLKDMDGNIALYGNLLDDEIEKAAAIHNYYANYSQFDYQNTLEAADAGDETAKAVLKEYNDPGISIACFQDISVYDYSGLTTENIYKAKYQFVSDNIGYLYSEEQRLRQDYTQGLINYISQQMPGITDLNKATIDGLNSRQMVQLSDALDSYLKANKEAPGALVSLVKEISRSGDMLRELDYIEKNKGNNELKTSTAAASSNADEALNFGQEIYNILSTDGDLVASLKEIMKKYNSLNPDVKSNLSTEFTEYIENIRNTLSAYNTYILASDFTSPANAFTLDEFIDVRCDGCSIDEKQRLREKLLPYSEREAYYAAPVTGSLITYLENRRTAQGYSDNNYSDIEADLLIDTYMNVISAGIPAYGLVNEEFSNFSKYYYFEDYLGRLRDGYGSAADKDVFLNAALDDYLAMGFDYVDAGNRDGYADFAQDYFSDTITSFAYLPLEAQFFTAYDNYYTGIFTDGNLLNTEAEISAYIDDHYLSKGFNTGIDLALRDYIASINTIDDYYGSDASLYRTVLTENERAAFDNYYYVTINTGLDMLNPGWDMMSQGMAMEISADIYLESELLKERAEELLGSMDSIMPGLIENSELKKKEALYANSLYEYNTNPQNFKSFRNYLLTDNYLTPVKYDGTQDTENAIDIHGSDPFGSGYRDTYNNNVIQTFIFEGEGSGEAMLDSMRIDAMNGIADKLSYIAAASGAVAARTDDTLANPRTISTYIDAVKPLLIANNEAGILTLNSTLAGIVGDSGSGSMPMSDLMTEIDNTAGLFANYKKQLISRGESFNLMLDQNEASLKASLEKQSGIIDIAQAAYNTTNGKLTAAQESYARENNNYITQMTAISTNYANYKIAEHEYEKAYSVWEYANTPYLKGSSQFAGGTGTGELDNLPAPDAKENYENILKRYTEAQTIFNQERTDWQNQDSIEKLRADIEYMKARSDLENKFESFIRVNRADILINKDIDELKQELDKAQKEYDAAKDTALGQEKIKINNEDVFQFDEEHKTEEDVERLTDEILSRMLPSTNRTDAEEQVKQYVDRFVLFYIVKGGKKSSDEALPKALAAKDAGQPAYSAYLSYRSAYSTYQAAKDALSDEETPPTEEELQAYEAARAAWSAASVAWSTAKAALETALSAAGLVINREEDEGLEDYYERIADETLKNYNSSLSYNNLINDAYSAFDPVIKSDMEEMEAHNLKYIDDIVNKLMLPAQNDRFYLDGSFALPRNLRNSTKYSLTRWVTGWNILYYDRTGTVKIHWEEKPNRDHTYRFNTNYKTLVDIALQKDTGFMTEHKDLVNKFMDVWDKRKKVNFLTNKIKAIDEVRDIAQIKQILSGSKYALTGADLGNIYDNSISFTPDDESVNITSLRRETERTDIDGHAVKARVSGGRIEVLDVKAGLTGEVFAAGNISYILRDDNGNIIYKADDNINDLQDGAEYYLSDYTYSISETAHVLSENYKTQARNMKNKYYEQAAGHDSTVALRDQEALYWDILKFANSFAPRWTETYIPEGLYEEATREKAETKSRSYDGYKEILSELLYNASGTTIDDSIVHGLVDQNKAFQEQVWEQQKEKFSERESRWQEVVSFIRSRGMRDWNNRMIGFANDWKKWRIESRQKIEEGEKEWIKTSIDLSNRRADWQSRMSTAGSEESVKNIYKELETKLSIYLANLNESLPEGVDIDIDTEKILSESLRNLPVSDLGVLKYTMNTTDTAAGFANMLNLNLSFDLQKRYEKEAEAFDDRMSIVQNLRMTEVFSEILENFNKQLEEANEGIYDQVNTDIRYGIPFRSFPFNRNTANNKWSIRYIEDYSLGGGAEHETMYFNDYRKYINYTVFLKPYKGLSGETINFTDPSTYANINPEDLEIYVGLEVQNLNETIEDTFRNGDKSKTLADGSNPDDGLFTKHVKDEFKRLGDSFGRGYELYLEGEAMANKNPVNQPIAPGAPSPRIVISVVATIVGAAAYGNAWVGVAVNAAFLAMDAAQGTISWQQMLIQTAISAAAAYAGGAATAAYGNTAGALTTTAINTGASGIDYEADGSVGWSNDKFRSGVKSGAVNMAITIAAQNSYLQSNGTLTAGIRGFLNSGIDTDNGSWWRIGWNNSKDAFAGGLAAGAATYFTSRNAPKEEPVKTADGTTPAGGERTDYTGAYNFNDYTNHLAYNTINSGLLSLYNMAEYGKSWSEASRMTGFWSGMSYSNPRDLGGFIGAYAQNPNMLETKKEREDRLAKERAEADSRAATESSSDPRQDPLGTAETMLGGLWQSLKKASEYTSDIFGSIAAGAKNLWESTGNLIAHGEFVNNEEYKFLYESTTSEEFYNSRLAKEFGLLGITDQEVQQTAIEVADLYRRANQEIILASGSDTALGQALNDRDMARAELSKRGLGKYSDYSNINQARETVNLRGNTGDYIKKTIQDPVTGKEYETYMLNDSQGSDSGFFGKAWDFIKGGIDWIGKKTGWWDLSDNTNQTDNSNSSLKQKESHWYDGIVKWFSDTKDAINGVLDDYDTFKKDNPFTAWVVEQFWGNKSAIYTMIKERDDALKQDVLDTKKHPEDIYKKPGDKLKIEVTFPPQEF